MRSEVARKKRYPNAARRRGETGTAVIRFVVARNGSMSGLQLVRSSGSDTLDKGGLEDGAKSRPLPRHPGWNGEKSDQIHLAGEFLQIMKMGGRQKNGVAPSLFLLIALLVL